MDADEPTGSTVCRSFDFCVARTGLTEPAAKQQPGDQPRPVAGRPI